MNGSVLGIDPSIVRPAFGLWPQRTTKRLDRMPGEGAERLDYLYGAAHAWITLNAPDELLAVFIELPRGKFEKRALDHSCAVLQLAALHALRNRYAHPVSVFEIAVGTWKKEALGNGAAKKDAVWQWASGQMPPMSLTADTISQDEADALAIARAGHSLIERGEA